MGKLALAKATIQNKAYNFMANDKMKRSIQIANYGSAALSLAIMSAAATPVFAAPGASSSGAGVAMSNLISIVLSIFRYVGIALFAWGAIQFILATKRSDADSKADAIQTAMCGIALILVKTVIMALGLGDTITNLNDTALDAST